MRSAATIRLQVEEVLADKIQSALTPAQKVIRPVAPTGVAELDALLSLPAPRALSAHAANVYQAPYERLRGDLELFVLALIESGVSTPYELQQAAGLTRGATILVLCRLLERRLVLTGEAGTRRRMAYALTAAGCKRRKDGWKNSLPAVRAGTLTPTFASRCLPFS
jgi:hypothetical protein